MSTSTDRVMGTQKGQYDAVFTDKKDNSTMDHMSFLKLLVAQMQNQDFTNPMDNSQMVTQMTQFANMQKMEEMANYSKSNYAMSLVGKTVTASRFTVAGALDTTTGVISKVSLVDNEYVLYIGDKKYTMDQIMSVENTVQNTGGIDPSKYKLAAKDITSDSATIQWQVPTTDEIAAAELKYSVYYSTDKNFNTLEQVEKGTLVGTKDQKGMTSIDMEGLDPNTEYYVNVVVTDKDGTKRIYKTIMVQTLKDETITGGKDPEDGGIDGEDDKVTGGGESSGTGDTTTETPSDGAGDATTETPGGDTDGSGTTETPEV